MLKTSWMLYGRRCCDRLPSRPGIARHSIISSARGKAKHPLSPAMQWHVPTLLHSSREMPQSVAEPGKPHWGQAVVTLTDLLPALSLKVAFEQKLLVPGHAQRL